MAAVVTPTLDLERDLASQGYDLIVGFDEVGRGALAGPAMVGAVAVWARDLPNLEVPEGVADSKVLTERKRENIFDSLRAWGAADAVGQVSNTEIDEWGITYALGVAALRALVAVEHQLGIPHCLNTVPSNAKTSETLAAATTGDFSEGFADISASGGSAVSSASSVSNGSADNASVDDLSAASAQNAVSAQNVVSAQGTALSVATVRVGAILDGPSDYITKALNTFDAPAVPVPAHVITKVKGDRYCATVASAAVIAKVTRDRLMVDIAHSNSRYAPYEWAHNKGYGSAAHREAIAKLGPTPLHRLSWHLT